MGGGEKWGEGRSGGRGGEKWREGKGRGAGGVGDYKAKT